MIDLAFENIDNTCPFNLTHHPALTVPCGMVEGCPVGMMLVAKPFAEATLYAAAYAFEQSTDGAASVPTAETPGKPPMRIVALEEHFAICALMGRIDPRARRRRRPFAS